MNLYITGSKFWTDYGAMWSALGAAYLDGYRDAICDFDTNVGRMVKHIAPRLGFLVHPASNLSALLGTKGIGFLVLREKGRGNKDCDHARDSAIAHNVKVTEVRK